MLFNTAEFLVFFILVTAVYYVIPRGIRYIWLLVASYLFYMNWNYKYGLLLFVTTLTTYLAALIVERYRERSRVRCLVIVVCFVINFGMLVFFKYTTFLIDNINQVIRISGHHPIDYVWNIALPVGISFYVFQAVSYLLDVNAGKVPVEKNFLRYALFVSFFPQLVAGPIERSGNLLRQLQNIREIRWDLKRITHGLTIMLWGFFLKMVIADRIAILVDTVFDHYTDYGSVELVIGAIGFAIQIYCDFAGYSTIAIGSAQVLGFTLMENFASPYLSGSVREFWRRWHISLSTWFRDYVYIPLGGSRQGIARKRWNILLTMGVSGLWHGANWTYVIWGLLHGIYQIIEDIFQKPLEWLCRTCRVKVNVFSYKLLKRLAVFVVVDIAWIFFRASDLKHAVGYIWKMFTKPDPWVCFDKSLYQLGLDMTELHILGAALLVLLVVDYVQYRRRLRIDEILAEQNLWFRWVVVMALFSVTWIYGIYGPAFDSSQFIYFQF